MTRPIGIIIVGAGSSARRHAQAALRVPDVTLVGFYDPVEYRARALAEEFRARAFTDLDVALASAPGALALICTPPASHGCLAIQGLSAGLHVLVEKPFELDLEFVSTVEAAADRRGLRAGAVAQHRFSPDVLALRTRVVEGAIGEIVSASVRVQRQRLMQYFEADNATWRHNPLLSGGGVLISVAFHYLDLACWILGHPSDARMTLFRQHQGIESEAVGSCVLGATPCAVEARWGDYHTLPDTLEIIGTHGRLTLSGDRLLAANQAAEMPARGDKYALHALQLQDMVEAIVEQRRPLVTPSEVEPSLRLINELYTSAWQVEREVARP
jgi:UDP-N-acetyl-2-amino-2-deoxyglucuronate dehydrogenase